MFTGHPDIAPVTIGVVPTGTPVFGGPVAAQDVCDDVLNDILLDAGVGGSPQAPEDSAPSVDVILEGSSPSETDAVECTGGAPHENPTPEDHALNLRDFFVRMFSSSVPEHVRRKPRDVVVAELDTYGPDYFLEEIARGSIPVELAFRHEWPVIHFMRWLKETADPQDYDYAMSLCADSLAAKSRTILELSPDNAQEGMMIREYAKRALDLAERIAPDGWSGSKRPKSDGPAQQAPLQIAIMLPGAGPDGAVRTIPGIELLGVQSGS